MSCEPIPENRTVPLIQGQNTAFQLSKDTQANRTLSNYVTEGLIIGGTPIRVFKLLGIHEQKKLSRLEGDVISNGEYPEFLANNVSLNDCSEWHSIKKCGGRDPNTYLGYDFGPIKLEDGSNKYAVHTEVKFHVTSILIQQGDLQKNRIIKARVENSNDGITWKGISLIDLPDDNNEHWIDIKQSYPARYWRISPITYLGKETDLWVVKKFALSEFTKTSIKNVQDEMGFLENRDRCYSTDHIELKAYYNLMDVTTDLSQFGINLQNQYNFKFGFDLTIQYLKRPIVIGDILDVIAETQYDTNLNPVKKYLEVTDVGWDSGSFTPGWMPTLYNVTAQPMIASQETMDLVGDLNNDFYDEFVEQFNTTALKLDKKIRAEANTEVPLVGGSINDAADATGTKYQKLAPDPKSYFLEDAMPPNNAPYTEGEKYPDKPKNNAYHRLTYSSALGDPIPTRLYRYSKAKNRWIFMEEDKRSRSDSTKPTIDPYIQSGIDITTIGR